jgi:transposase
MNNYYQNKWMMYHEIQRLEREGLRPSQIASYLVMDTRTVKKILLMSEAGYENYLEQLSQRAKKLAPFEKFVKERLEDCPMASAAQVKDWLMEYHPELKKVCDKTVYNFVLYVREEHRIPRVFEGREYRMIEELPYGKQVQADFGEFNMTDVEGHRRKVYFLAMVMARSRYKHVTFQDHPFATEEVCVAHDKAFEYFGGYPEVIVYDQDKLLLVKENAGDLILTSTFASYTSGKPFRLHFCRKSDPQSKGKVENVVKYIKYNFLRGRKYHDIHVLNSQAIEWLERTANAKIHCTTRLVPRQEWLTEKECLQPVQRMYEPRTELSTYHVRKDNTISFKGSLYSLPDGTYRKNNNQILVDVQGEELLIFDTSHNEIARHKISLIKGVLVKNNNHYRDTSIKISEKIVQVAQYFSNTSSATEYLERIQKELPRYIRDQINIIEKCCKQYIQSDLDLAMNYCVENAIYKAADFAAVIKSITVAPASDLPSLSPTALTRHRIIPQKSDISDYKPIFN